MRAVKILLSSLLLVALVACTVIPKTPRAKVASFDGNAQNSGLIAVLPDCSGLYTAHAVSRYQLLARDYGYKFKPAVQGDEGLTVYSNSPAGPVWKMDAEHRGDFGIMEMWKRKGVK